MTELGGRPGGGVMPGWRWDVALSFAGEQREYVEQVAEALQALGVRCFYDADEQIELWGKYLAEELPVIYGEQAAAVVVFISAEYAARDWTRHERRAALVRALRERREYVLPARFDDTPLPGLLADMVAIDLRGRPPQQFAVIIADKLAALARDQGHKETAAQLPREPDEPRRKPAQAEHRAEAAQDRAGADTAVPAVETESPMVPGGSDEFLVYSMSTLSRELAYVMSEIQSTGKRAFITRQGQFVAVITPLAPGQAESRTVAEKARENEKRKGD